MTLRSSLRERISSYSVLSGEVRAGKRANWVEILVEIEAEKAGRSQLNSIVDSKHSLVQL